LLKRKWNLCCETLNISRNIRVQINTSERKKKSYKFLAATNKFKKVLKFMKKSILKCSKQRNESNVKNCLKRKVWLCFSGKDLLTKGKANNFFTCSRLFYTRKSRFFSNLERFKARNNKVRIMNWKIDFGGNFSRGYGKVSFPPARSLIGT
jgi:hypothetical protein